jgi:predicted restriction endonuclease
MTEAAAKLREITNQIIALKSPTTLKDQPINMEQAALLREVKETKLYKEGFGTFGDYCDHLGYGRQHIYDVIRISEDPLLSKYYSDIGVAKTRAINRLSDRLDETQKCDLIDFAREHTQKELQARIKKVEAIERATKSDLEALRAEEEYVEGKMTDRFIKHYERDSRLRTAAISFHGTKCWCCGFDFEEFYGERGAGYIEVHHLRPVSSLKEETRVDPKVDMMVLCANCHRMIHRCTNKVLSPEELKRIISKQKRLASKAR